MAKKWQFKPHDPKIATHLQEVLGIDPIFCQLLAQRGITTYEAAKAYFRPNIADLHDPFLMKDMNNAVVRLQQAIHNQENILIYGDYDVDGTTSVAMMYEFLNDHHAGLDYYIPDRYKEGYGISMQGIDYAKQNNVQLIIAIDCGINAVKQIAHASTLGIDFIICDHHLPASELPKAVAVLDPTRSDCDYPYKKLSGCGVAFKLMQGFLQHNQLPTSALNRALDLLVVSIACDIMPMTGENRILAHFGLKQLNRQPRSGFRALIHVLGREFPFSISDVVFGIGPSINAAGRLADARLAVRLLLAKDKKVALHLAQELKFKNDKRKDFEREITKEAINQVEHQENWQQLPAIVVYEPSWHKGVIGIVASKLVDRYHRPSIVLTLSNEQVVGSARSIRGIDVHEAIDKCSEWLVNFGGHQHAAGLTLLPEHLVHFRKQFENIIQQQIQQQQLDTTPIQHIDAPLDFEQITPSFLNILKQFAPFGPQNRRPVFASKGVRDAGRTKVLKGNHLSLDVQQKGALRMKGIGFGLGDVYNDLQQPSFEMCYVIEEDTWKGRQRTRLRAKDIRG